MSEIVIRQARQNDAAALKALLDRSWRSHWGPHVSAVSLQRYSDEQPAHGYVDHCLGQFIVADRDGEVVGMHHLEGDYLHAIHVAVGAIGSGVGARLMADAEERGARRLEVRSFNARARGFYRHRGWVEVREEPAEEMGTPCVTIIMERP